MKTLITICSLLTVMSLEAQIGLGTIKSKVKTATTTNDNSEGSKPKNQEPDDKEKLAISKSPASSVIWDFKIAMKSFEDALAGPRALDELAKAETKLAAIKKQDPSFSYIRDYEKRVELGKKNREIKLAEGASEDEIFDEIDIMSSVAREIKYSTRFYELRRTRFDSLEVAYTQWKAKGHSTGNLDGGMTTLYNFYGQNEESNVTRIIGIYNEELEKAMKYVKAKRQATDMDETFDISGFETALKEIIPGNEMLQLVLFVYPKNEKLINAAKQYKEVTDDLSAFKDGGEVDAIRARRKAASLSAVRMNKSMMTDAAVIECVKKELLKSDKYKSYKRIIITYSQWQIEKNSFGIPLHKEVNVQFAYTNKEGGCSFSNVLVKRVYNGSTYESMYADMSILTWPEEILCENVNK